MAPRRTFEDFEIGRDYPLGTYAVTREEIIAFAREFDPQTFHLDDDAARDSLFAGLSASGWHTTAMMMRLLVDGLLADTEALGGAGVETLVWKRPVRPDDRLTGRAVPLAKRRSTSRPGMGIVRTQIVLVNQDDAVVLDCVATILCAVREPVA